MNQPKLDLEPRTGLCARTACSRAAGASVLLALTALGCMYDDEWLALGRSGAGAPPNVASQARRVPAPALRPPRQMGLPLDPEDMIEPLPSVCEEQPALLMRRDFTIGGCMDTAYGGCHSAATGEAFPDLESPGVTARLLGVRAQCDRSRLLIVPGSEQLTESVFAQVLTPEIGCGTDQMPAFPAFTDSPAALATRACLESWVLQVAAAGAELSSP